MIEPKRTVPDWYKADWTPATGPDCLPPMTWQDLETVLDQLARTPERKVWAEHLFARLQRTSDLLSPMDLLQQIILTASVITAPMSGPAETPPSKADLHQGALPRWSLTDLEWAINYSVSGQKRAIALERQRDLLRRRGELDSGAETLRSIFLIGAGLLSGKASRTRNRLPRARAA